MAEVADVHPMARNALRKKMMQCPVSGCDQEVHER